MKTQRQPKGQDHPASPAKQTQVRRFALALTLAALTAGLGSALAQGTAFTYQGRLTDNGNAANGNYDLRFTIYDTSGGNTVIAGPLTSSAVPVANGLFTVTLNFGAGVFTGPARWLNIEAQPAGGGGFTPLLPRQPLTPSPYAIAAGNLAGTLPDAQLSPNIPRLNANSSFTGTENFSPASGAPFTVGSSTKVVNLNADLLDGLDSTAFWQLGGNLGTTPGVNFLGTGDNKALELKVNNSRALRLEPQTDDAPNVIGGSVANSVVSGTVGSAIGGGGNGYFELLPELSGGFVFAGANTVGSDFGTIAGGGFNVISNASHFGVIAGGVLNSIQTNSPEATIGGGFQNTIQTNAAFATIVGGVANTAAGLAAFVGGGGYDGVSFPPAGNSAGGTASVIVGGVGNAIPIWDHFSFIGGGAYNQISPPQGVYAVNTLGATIGGGGLNTNYGSFAAIPGGYQNVAEGSYSFAAGQNAKALHNGVFIWADDSSSTPFASTAVNQFLVRATFMGLNRTNPVTGSDCFAIRSPATSGYGGMYVDTAGSTALPFYGYALAGNDVAWTYVDGSDGNKWKLSYGMTVTPGGSVSAVAFNPTSDRNAKEDFQTVDTHEVLSKVAAMPISRWHFKTDPGAEHLGPMAQDFRASFGLGSDEKHIATVDADGVALASIQALNDLIKEKDSRIADLEHRLASQEALVAELKSAHRQADTEWESRLARIEKALARLSDAPTTESAINDQPDNEP